MQKKHFSILILSCLLYTNSLQAMEDEEYEKRIHNIYLKHYKDPISNSDWNDKIQSLPSKHQLKFKDNLWDLSGSFFQDSLYWSKMWVVNPQVENPHLIYRGDFIKIDPQSLSAVNTSEYSVDIQSQFPGLIVPKNPLAKRSLPESEMPSSLPKLLSFIQFDDEIDVSKIHGVEVEKQITVPFYLTSTSPSTAGKIIGKNGYGKAMGIGGEQLVVKIDSTVSIGSVFTVFENRGRVGNLLQFITGLNEDEIAVKGKLRILSYIRGSDSLYLASVIEALDKMSKGDSLLQGEPISYNFSQKGNMGSGEGRIIGTPNKNQNLLNLGSIVYLNKGTKDGIYKQRFFYIRGNTDAPTSFQRPHQYEQPVLGKLQIIHSSDNTSTGVIVSAKSQIYVGDIFTGSSDKAEDLSHSEDHEVIDEDLEQGEDLLIDVEEVEEEIEEDKEEVMEEDKEDKDDIEEMEEIMDEDMEDMEEMEEIGEFIDEDIEDSKEDVQLEEDFDEEDLEDEEEDSVESEEEEVMEEDEDFQLEEDFDEGIPSEEDLEEEDESDNELEEMEEMEEIDIESDNELEELEEVDIL